MDPKYGLLEVIAGDGCEGCVYNTDKEKSCLPDSIIAGPCDSIRRMDKTSAKFIPCTIETRPIGSVFTDPIFGKLKVVEGDDCKDCIYYFREDRDEENVGYCKKNINPGYCGPKYRTDGKTVIFIKYKEMSKIEKVTERPIGSTFDDPKYGKIQVVEGTTSCRGCIYENMDHRVVNCDILFTGYCHKDFRSDKKNVIFKHVDNE